MFRSLLRLTFVMICAANAALAQALIPMEPDQQREWSAVGVIAISATDRQGACSGALIAPDLVLTAAHCAFGNRDNPRGLVFAVAGLGRGTLSAFTAAKVEIHPQYTKVETDLERYGVDLALITLARRVPAGMATPLAVQADPGAGLGDGIFGILGFDRTTPGTLRGRFDCLPIPPSRPDRVRLNCAVFSGNSGAPVLQRTDTGWQIIGVAVARIGRGEVAQSLIARGDDWLSGRLVAAGIH